MTPATPIEFDTARQALRAWQHRHRAPFAAMNVDPEVMRFFPALLSVEQTNAGVDIWCRQFAERGWSNWAVERLDTGECIGFIGLSVPRPACVSASSRSGSMRSSRSRHGASCRA